MKVDERSNILRSSQKSTADYDYITLAILVLGLEMRHDLRSNFVIRVNLARVRNYIVIDSRIESKLMQTQGKTGFSGGNTPSKTLACQSIH